MVAGVLLVLALPVVMAAWPERVLARWPARMLIALPSLIVAGLWWAGPGLLLIYTLPAVGIVAGASAILVGIARSRRGVAAP